MRSSQRKTPCRLRELASILDSDDELPDSYEDTPELPAYLNDARFDHIRLPWLDNCKPIKLSKPLPKQTASISVQEIEQSSLKLNADVTENLRVNESSPQINAPDSLTKFESVNQNCKIVISKGVLTARDLFLVKSIEEHCTETTLVWFIELLKNKAFPNRTPMSCLAGDIINIDYTTNDHNLFRTANANYYYNLMVCK